MRWGFFLKFGLAFSKNISQLFIKKYISWSTNNAGVSHLFGVSFAVLPLLLHGDKHHTENIIAITVSALIFPVTG